MLKSLRSWFAQLAICREKYLHNDAGAGLVDAAAVAGFVTSVLDWLGNGLHGCGFVVDFLLSGTAVSLLRRGQ